MSPIFCTPPQKYKILLKRGVQTSTPTVQEILDWTTVAFHSRWERELFYVFLAILEHAVSSIMLREVDGEQRPIYFISKTFTNFQIRYLPLEKLILPLVLTSWKLMHYFQANPIIVYMEFLLKNVLPKADLSSQLSKWAIWLEQSNIKFCWGHR